MRKIQLQNGLVNHPGHSSQSTQIEQFTWVCVSDRTRSGRYAPNRTHSAQCTRDQFAYRMFTYHAGPKPRQGKVGSQHAPTARVSFFHSLHSLEHATSTMKRLAQILTPPSGLLGLAFIFGLFQAMYMTQQGMKYSTYI